MPTAPRMVATPNSRARLSSRFAITATMIPLCLLFLLFVLLGSVDALPDKYQTREAPDMDPIHIDDFEAVTGIARRDGPSPLDHIVPSGLSHLSYGRQGTADTFLTGNMTLYAPDGSLLVTMERFEDLTSAVDCQGRDGELSITFKSKEIFDHALEQWKYINDDDSANFLLITNHDGCGAENQRQVYRISKVDSQEDTLRTVMTSKAVEWIEIASDLDLDFGHVTLAPGDSSRLRRRTSKRDLGFDQHSKWSLGTPNKKFLIFKDPTRFPPRVTVSCDSCYTKVDFRSAGTLKTRGWIPQGFTYSLDIKEFSNELNFLVELVREKDYIDSDWPPGPKWLDAFEQEWKLLEAPVPYLSFKIPGVITAGLSLALILHKELQTFGRFSFNMGAKWNIPGGSKLYIDTVNPEKTSITGFEHSSPDFFWNPKAGNIEAQMLVFFGPRIDIGLELFEKLEFELQTQFRSPALTANLSTGYDPNGYCKGKKQKTGVKFVAQANLQIWAKIPKPDWASFGTMVKTMIAALNLPIVPDWNDFDDALAHGTKAAVDGVKKVGGKVADIAGDAWDAVFKRELLDRDHELLQLYDGRLELDRLGFDYDDNPKLLNDDADDEDGDRDVEFDLGNEFKTDIYKPSAPTSPPALQARGTPKPTAKHAKPKTPSTPKHKATNKQSKPSPKATPGPKHAKTPSTPKHASTKAPKPTAKHAKPPSTPKHAATAKQPKPTAKPSTSHAKPKSKPKHAKPKVKNLWQSRIYNSGSWVHGQKCFPLDIPFLEKFFKDKPATTKSPKPTKTKKPTKKPTSPPKGTPKPPGKTTKPKPPSNPTKIETPPI